jgi:hypothetical protein
MNDLATPDLRRVIVTHGDMLKDRPAETLKAVAAKVS